jgi:hypothetical protein
MKTCIRYESCGFVRKYEHSNNIDCRGFIYSYCKGNKINECARLEYITNKGEYPSDDMLPSGKIMDCEEKYEPYGNNSQQYY